jgi:hypothetical protein
LFIVDYLIKVLSATNLDGFCFRQNNFRQNEKIVEPLKTAMDKAFREINFSKNGD